MRAQVNPPLRQENAIFAEFTTVLSRDFRRFGINHLNQKEQDYEKKINHNSAGVGISVGVVVVDILGMQQEAQIFKRVEV